MKRILCMAYDVFPRDKFDRLFADCAICQTGVEQILRHRHKTGKACIPANPLVKAAPMAPRSGRAGSNDSPVNTAYVPAADPSQLWGTVDGGSIKLRTPESFSTRQTADCDRAGRGNIPCSAAGGAAGIACRFRKITIRGSAPGTSGVGVTLFKSSSRSARGDVASSEST